MKKTPQHTPIMRGESSIIPSQLNHKAYKPLLKYRVVATDVPSLHCGIVAVFCRASPRFTVEAIQQFGPNVVIFQLAMSGRWWYIIVCYLAPDDALVT